MAKTTPKIIKATAQRAQLHADIPKSPDVKPTVEEAPKQAKASPKNVTVIVTNEDQVFVNVNGKRRNIERGVATSIPANMVAVLENGGVTVAIQK